MSFPRFFAAAVICGIVMSVASTVRADCIYNMETHSMDCSGSAAEPAQDVVNQAVQQAIDNATNTMQGAVSGAQSTLTSGGEATIPEKLIAIYVVMFGEVPKAENLAMLTSEVEDGRKTLRQIAADLDSANFRARFPAFLTAEEFADRLDKSLFDDVTPEATRNFAKGLFVSRVHAGISDTDIIVEAIEKFK